MCRVGSDVSDTLYAVKEMEKTILDVAGVIGHTVLLDGRLDEHNSSLYKFHAVSKLTKITCITYKLCRDHRLVFLREVCMDAACAGSNTHPSTPKHTAAENMTSAQRSSLSECATAPPSLSTNQTR